MSELYQPTIINNGLGDRYLNMANELSGLAPMNNQLQNFFTGIDKFGHNTLPPNSLHAGFTFITRPKLCLHDAVLAKQIEFAPMLQSDRPNSLPFAIRCLLDTKFHRDSAHGKDTSLVDVENPFFVPLMSGLTSISGYPSMDLETQTSDAGFHSEDQTIVTGYNQLNKTYDLSLEFRDPQRGPLMAIFYYWLLNMGYLAKGIMPAYSEDIIRRKLNYTVSIYRFVLDPSKKFIMHWSKATGCFPKSVPVGDLFNYSSSEKFIRGAGQFSIPFVANKIEIDNPVILSEFNFLMDRYLNTTEQGELKWDDRRLMDISAENNYVGLPRIVSGLAPTRHNEEGDVISEPDSDELANYTPRFEYRINSKSFQTLKRERIANEEELAKAEADQRKKELEEKKKEDAAILERVKVRYGAGNIAELPPEEVDRLTKAMLKEERKEREEIAKANEKAIKKARKACRKINHKLKDDQHDVVKALEDESKPLKKAIHVARDDRDDVQSDLDGLRRDYSKAQHRLGVNLKRDDDSDIAKFKSKLAILRSEISRKEETLEEKKAAVDEAVKTYNDSSTSADLTKARKEYAALTAYGVCNYNNATSTYTKADGHASVDEKAFLDEYGEEEE